MRFQCQLPTAARKKAAQSVAMAVCLDIRPLRSEEGNQGMHHFAKTIFEMGHTVAENEKWIRVLIYQKELLLLTQ